MGNNKRKYFKDEIKKAFILYALVPIMIISLLFYNILFLSFKNLSDRENKATNNIIGNIIEEEFNAYEESAISISQNIDIQKILMGEYSINNDIYENFYNIVNERRIRSIFHIYNISGENVMTNAINQSNDNINAYSYMWGIIKKMNANPDETAMQLNRVQINANTRTVYSIGKSIVHNGKVIGFVVFDILENELNDVISLYSNENVVITDKYNNNIISTNNALLDRIGKLRKIEDSENLKVIVSEKVNGNIYIHTFKSISFINNIYFIGELFLIVLFSIMLILMIYYANKIAISKTKSVDELLDGISSVQNGDFTNKVSIKTNDEFELIGDYYNEMVIKVQELIEKNKEEAMQVTLSQIKLLESQFNPHFIFNTLEMLRYMIKAKDDSSEKVLLSMSRILRYSIDNTIRTTKLIEDIKYIQDYLTIQKFRFGNKFDYNISIRDECKNCTIPKLIIQPIVENSIKYGFQDKDYLLINVNSYIKKNNLIIDIIDNGEGISREELFEIKRILNNSDNSSTHIGLYNVQKRISLLYGQEFGIKIESEKEKGTKVSIKLPID